jgi:hypothetical protein
MDLSRPSLEIAASIEAVVDLIDAIRERGDPAQPKSTAFR